MYGHSKECRTRQGFSVHKVSRENGEGGSSESADSLVVEHESAGCVVASSALQNKYHSLLHPCSIL